MERTCFESLDNPSCIDLFLTNGYQSFQNTTTESTGLFDFHKMVVTVMKTTFPKAKPKTDQYKDEKNFIAEVLRIELRGRLHNKTVFTYAHFDETFFEFIEQIINPI